MSVRTQHPVVDVGIPSYGRPRYIIETIESVLAQTFTPWRLTISDDGPGGGDVAAAIAPYLDDPRIRYSPAGAQIGVAANWSRVIELATAPYVAILHDDDRWGPGFLARRVAFLEANPECGFVYSGTKRIDEDGAVLAEWRPALEEGDQDVLTFARRLLTTNIVGSTAAVLVRREAFESVGPTFEGRLPHCDYEMWVRLALRFPVGYLDGCDADYRLHRASTTHRIRPSAKKVLRLADHFVAVADRERPGLLQRADRRKVRREMLLNALAFDALTTGDRRYASYLLGRAVALDPRAAFDPRAVDWLRIAIGPRLRRLIARRRGRPAKRHTVTELGE
jgi:glycosyltransferase involved in cell wall biosynthesis